MLDDQAFMLEFYSDYYGLVRRAVEKAVRDTNQVEDLIHDTFLRLLDKISVLRTLDRCRLVAYVVYTSRSVCINYIRRQVVQDNHLCYGLEADLADEITDPGEAVEDLVLYRQDTSDLWKTIFCLPERQKDLLYLKYVLELDDAQIAKGYNISPAGVRQALTRARRAVKRLTASKEESKHDEHKSSTAG